MTVSNWPPTTRQNKTLFLFLWMNETVNDIYLLKYLKASESKSKTRRDKKVQKMKEETNRINRSYWRHRREWKQQKTLLSIRLHEDSSGLSNSCRNSEMWIIILMRYRWWAVIKWIPAVHFHISLTISLSPTFSSHSVTSRSPLSSQQATQTEIKLKCLCLFITFKWRRN